MRQFLKYITFLVTISSFGVIFGSDTGSLVIATSIPMDLKKQILLDLKSIKSIEGSWASMLHREIYGEVYGPNYLDFFNKRVRIINIEDTSGEGLRNNAVAYYDQFSDQMILTQNYVHYKHPQIARVMTLFHEARHAEKLHSVFYVTPDQPVETVAMKYPHIDCPREFKNWKGEKVLSIWTHLALAGQAGACDETEFGAYGSSSVMLKNIQKNCANCSSKTRWDAGIYADDQIQRITDHAAFLSMLKDLYSLGL